MVMSRKERIEWVLENFKDDIKKLIQLERDIEKLGFTLDAKLENQFYELEYRIIISIMSEFYTTKNTSRSYLDTAKQQILNEQDPILECPKCGHKWSVS